MLSSRLRFGTALLLSLLNLGPAARTPPSFAAGIRPSLMRAGAMYGRLPVAFEANRGQAGSGVRFLAHLPGATLYLTHSFVLIRLPAGGSVRLQPLGASPRARLIGLHRLPGRVNYFLGDDPRRWRTDIPTYAAVELRDVYPGVDLLYGSSAGKVEYTWVVRPGARADGIRLAVRGGHGGIVSGRLRIGAGRSYLLQSAPTAYQPTVAGRHVVEARWVQRGADVFSYALGRYDARRVLLIDPVLSYSLYLGGSGHDFASDVAVDAQGNAYLTGATDSTDFPIFRAAQPSRRGSRDGTDAFVSKLDPSGTGLVYSTYLGGGADDFAHGIAIDAHGDAYVVGGTASQDFPLTTALRCPSAAGDLGNAFITKLGPAGDRLVYSSCLGGKATDSGIRVAVDASGDAFVVGSTASPDFPTVGALQPQLAGQADVFVARVAPSGDRLLYSTYLGGGGDDEGTDIALDAAGDAYVCGSTTSSDFPAVHALQAVKHAGSAGSNGFVAKLATSGRQLIFSTYLGGSGNDVVNGVAVDGQGNAYLTGATTSPDFPTVTAVQSTYGGQTDAFLSKLAPDGTSLIYSTFLGGSDHDEGLDVGVDPAGDAYLTGFSRSHDFPVAQAVQPLYGGGYYYGDAVVAALDPAGRTLLFSTYLGGSSDDVGMGMAVDPNGNVFVAGGTSSIDFPLQGPRGMERPPFGDAFVSKIAPGVSSSSGLPSITVDRVIMLRQVKGTLQLTRTLHLSQKGVFIVLYHARNAGHLLPSARIRFVRNGRTIYQGAMSRVTLTDGTPYFRAVETFRARAMTGRITAHVSLHLSSANDTFPFTFTLKASR